ncbi:MAG TPA: hypothetical protein PKZ17_01220 [Thermodesulfovibrio thiophilus]|uniref:hypothetical protein n=1 Tax=Thermodesulfovibrio thiophilus TaxID=340095 RepID=UPI00182AEC9E|nr:hypothetical protein [Thermodesulfovibrio thiophilus]HHW20319.1 hypothetical protein [Thermodesulfovibrio thiophilus]HOA82648.1 hypothetical protein [Thermodesulfovibrio thiophilus]HQA03337.1 hypothetical protein [Thermodesulfovibrio thiophilus]HQD35747.1 hypothetical protein [Thermodesulfovibrio thiophilus]
MIRFEELQMKIMDAAKNYLDVFDMATLIEQYSLNKESKLSMTLPEIKPPYPISATVSFSYNAHQTSFSILLDEDDVEDEEENFDNMVEVEVVINLPFIEEYNQLGELFEEIVNEYPDLDPILIKKEFFRKDLVQGEEYEIVYSYMVGGEELKDLQFYEEMFFELSNILQKIYDRMKFYIDISWYRADEDDSF